MPQKTSRLTIDHGFMEKFFAKNIYKFFPEAKKFKKLSLTRQSTIAREDFIVRYEISFIDNNGKNKTSFVRGAARDDGSKYHGYKIMKLLWDSDFRKGAFGVPRPLGYNFYLKQSLYEECPGEILYRRIEKNKNLKTSFRKSAGWLAKLHRLQVKTGAKTHSLRKEGAQIKKMKNLFSEISHRYHPFKSENFSGIVNAFWNLEKKYLKPKDFILIHNDFNPGNIILSKDRTYCIDFVDSCRFHPVTDLGTLLAYIHSPLSPLISKHKFSQKIIEALEKKFVAEYCQPLGIKPESIQNQIAVFKARAFLIMAMHLAKLSLGWGKHNGYKWADDPLPAPNKKRPVKIYNYFNNPRLIKLIVEKAEACLKKIK